MATGAQGPPPPGMFEDEEPEGAPPLGMFEGEGPVDYQGSPPPDMFEDEPEPSDLESRARALEQDYLEYNRMREEYARAKRTAESLSEPTAKYRAAAMAGYLKDKMVNSKPDEEELETFLATARLPDSMPGQKAGIMAGADVVDFATSPISRPLFSGLSVSADTAELNAMTSKKRAAWINNLHPDDPRAQIYWEMHEQIDAANREGITLGPAEIKEGLWGTALLGVYESPGIDPYGGGLPRPWQEVSRGGIITGGEPATTTDIIVRAFSRGKDRAEDANRWRSRIHGAFEYGERPFEALGALMPGGESPGEAWNRSGEEAYKVWSGDPDADPWAGSFLPSLLFTVVPDIGVSVFTKGARAGGSAATAAGVLTKHGDSAVSASTSRAIDRVVSAAREADSELSREGIDALVDATRNASETVFAAVGDAASRGAKVGVAAGKEGEDFISTLTSARGGERIGVVHVDLDDAVTLKIGDDGSKVVNVDASKARVLYNDDPLVKSATKDAVLRGLDDSEKALLRKALDDMGADDLTSAEIFANLKSQGISKKIALAGGLGFGAGLALSPTADTDFFDRLESGFKGGLAGLLGGAVVFGGGKGIGTVVDSSGRAAAKIGFPTGSFRLERLEKMRAGLPGFKELKPWAYKSADGVWRPVEVADMVGDHMWARHKFLLRRKGFTDAMLRAETQEAVYNTMSGVYRKKDREIATSLAEALGVGGKHEDIAQRLLVGLRRHLQKSLRFLPKEENKYFDIKFDQGESLGKRFDTKKEMWESFDLAVKADDIDTLESFIRAKGSSLQSSGVAFFETLNKRARSILSSTPDSKAGRYLKAEASLVEPLTRLSQAEKP